MQYAKTTSIAALAAFLMLGAPVMAQSTGNDTGNSPSASSQSGSTDSTMKDQSPALNSTTGPGTVAPSAAEGRNNTMNNPGDARAAGSGNTDTDRRDCTNTQTPC